MGMSLGARHTVQQYLSSIFFLPSTSKLTKVRRNRDLNSASPSGLLPITLDTFVNSLSFFAGRTQSSSSAQDITLLRGKACFDQRIKLFRSFTVHRIEGRDMLCSQA